MSILQFKVEPQVMKTYNGTTVKVIGVGSTGCNTISYISKQKLKHVRLVACDLYEPELKIVNHVDTLYLKGKEQENNDGFVDTEIIRNAVLNKSESIKTILLEGNPEIVFIVAEMGDLTGSVAAPEIARIVKELGMVTIGVITAPTDSTVAEAGVTAMKQHTDTTIMLSTEKLKQEEAFMLKEDGSQQLNIYVATAVRAIAEIVTITAEVNVDVYDVRTVMEGACKTTVGSGLGVGQGRAMIAAQEAIAMALFGNEIQGADRVLLSIISGPEAELEMDELVEITEFIQNSTSDQAEVIFGHAIDDDLGNKIRVTFIASSFSEN
jgi:cell division protein FtsZ